MAPRLMYDILLFGMVFCIFEVTSKKIFASLDGYDWELCGSFAVPCASIKYAITKRSKQGDHIMIDGRKGKKGDSFEEFGIWLEKAITIEGFNGKPVIKCRNSSVAFTVKNSKGIFKNLEFKFHLLDFALERRTQFYLEKSIAIAAYASSIDIINCHFRCVPVALKSFCIGNCKYIITDSIFESPYRAVQVYDVGGRGLITGFLVRNKFIGLSNFSVGAIYFSLARNSRTKEFSTRQWNIFIDWCIFTYFGESIHAKIKGNLHLRLYNSEFRHNYLLFRSQTSSAALGLYDYGLKNNKFSRIVIIVNCTFVNNTCDAGGAIQFDTTTENSALRITNCTFKLNTAMRSGGAVSATGVFEINLKDSIFRDNFCGFAPFPKRFFSSIISLTSIEGFGGTLYFTSLNSWVKTGPVEVDNCVFKNNSAEEQGDSVYTDKLLKLSSVYIESAQHRRDGYVLHTVISSNSFIFIRNTTIKIFTTTNNRDVANLGSGFIRIDEHSKFICSKGGILHHKALSLSPDIKNVPSKYPIELRTFSFYCEICPPDYYSLHESVLQNRTLTGRECMRCSSGGQCRSGLINAKDNFWGFKDINTDRITFIQLPKGYGCTGKECITYNVCAPHRKGTLCGTCSNGYSESAISSECISNKECQRVKFWLIAVISLALFLIFILYKEEITKFIKSQFRIIRTQQQQQEAYDDRDVALITDDVYVPSDEYVHNNARSEDPNNMIVDRHKEDDSDIVTGFVKILSYFYQIEFILRAYSNDAGSHIFQGLRHSVSSFFNFQFSMGQGSSVTCALFDMTPIWKVVLRISLVVMVFVVLLVILIFVKIYKGIKDRVRQRSNLNILVVSKGKSFSDRLLLAIFEIILLSYAVITKSVFTLLTCVKVSNKQVLFIQGTVQCYEPWQYVLMGVGLCWVIPFCLFVMLLPGLLRERQISKKGVFFGILFPLLFLLYVLFVRCLMKEQDEQQNPVPLMDSILKLISGPFKIKHKHQMRWEGVYLLRRLILVSINSFVQDQIYKLYSLLLMQVLFLLHHVYMRPFKNKLLNMVETISLTALIMLNCVKTFAVYDAKHGLHEEGADLLLLKIFGWTELALVLFAPVVIGVIVGVLIIARIATVIFKLCKYLYRCVG